MILHFTPRASWEAAKPTGSYVPAEFDRDGFVHCSPAERVHVPANLLVRGQHGLVLLVIDPSRLTSPVVEEAPYPGATITYPHVYGPIDVDAVVDVVSFEPGPDGRFSLPAGLAHLRPVDPE